MATDMTVPNVILEQLGGRRFMLMTGAKHLLGSEYALSFRIGRGALAGINYIRVTLNALDTYDVDFLKVRGRDSVAQAREEGVYAEDLRRVFTRVTGFETSLGTMGARS